MMDHTLTLFFSLDVTEQSVTSPVTTDQDPVTTDQDPEMMPSTPMFNPRMNSTVATGKRLRSPSASPEYEVELLLVSEHLAATGIVEQEDT